MGGISCWKHIIDQFNALTQVVNCMAESIRIAGSPGGSGVLPDYGDQEEFQKAAEVLAKVAAGIQNKVGGGQ
jgi:hypothetical protein